ncbi:H/ACA ribonucleoprotein complex non-core subunit NAF1 [Cylas formicarius]|uniref:H/ACA ribonucleoprotein complex non-core subunit NAF1 n=1 Tax=Cylas formicarius TaxID=197179 RepID=UPI0029586D9D|nr:H/ACA ribonucleoprotein complex non-core subunit NAF1 [Cylas formicarius]
MMSGDNANEIRSELNSPAITSKTSTIKISQQRNEADCNASNASDVRENVKLSNAYKGAVINGNQNASDRGIFVEQTLNSTTLLDDAITNVQEIASEAIGEGKIIKESAVIVNKESDSLRSLHVYDDSEDSNSDSCIDEQGNTDKVNGEQNWRQPVEVDTSDTESDSSTDYSLDENTSDDDASSKESVIIQTPKSIVRSNKNMDIPDEDLLPPVPDFSQLNINLLENDFMLIGQVVGIVNKLVTIEAFPNTPAFDVETFLFINHESTKKPIGEIFDILGPVSAPMYTVRFNSLMDIENLGLKQGVKIFAAPKSQYSKYVFVSQLMKMKGSDASWLNDEEPPPELLEFSDDEQEMQARKSAKRAHIKRAHNDSFTRHQQYEKAMNQCNLLNTKVSRLVDARRNIFRQSSPFRDMVQGYPISPVPNTMRVLDSVSHIPPAFDPSVPPPGFPLLHFIGDSAPWGPHLEQRPMPNMNPHKDHRHFPGPSSKGV